MSASNNLETNLLKLLFQNIAFAGIGDAGGLQPAATAGSLYISLHTSDPGEAGNQSSNECAYTSYARVAVARSAGGWTVAAANVANAGAVTFPQCTGGSESATHFGIGTDASGAGTLLFSGALDASLAIANLITPEFAAGALDVDAD
jgi:hypothetical protein